MKKAIKITAVTEHSIGGHLQTVLEHLGIHDIYVSHARIPVLEEPRGLLSYVSSKKKFTNRPVDVLTFYIENASLEDSTLSYIAAEGKFHLPGMGSVYSENVVVSDCHPLCKPSKVEHTTACDQKLYEGLVGIFCVVQRGQADAISRIILEQGTMPPTITFGHGMGIRDKLGLLRITIPPEKEILNLVTTAWESKEVIDYMIAKGKLDQPGRGFINSYPIRKGIINHKVTTTVEKGSVTVEHIAATLDKLTGNLEWRKSAVHEEDSMDINFFSGKDLNIICNAGTGIELVKAAINAGCGGATIENLTLNGKAEKNPDYVLRARERCKLMVPNQKIRQVLRAVNAAGARSDKAQGFLYNNDVLDAFTYIR